MKKTLLSAVMALGLGLGSVANAAGGSGEIKNFDFSFEGIFGAYDQAQLQRGLGVYVEVCAACHGLRQVAFRTLGDHGGPHFSEAEVKALAAQYDIYDAELDEDLPGKVTDKFPRSALETAPDLSLMAKARAGGPDYIASLLTSYTGKEKSEAGATLYENKAFDGGYISMAQPLSDGQVEFADGAPNDVKHMAEDVSAFLMWAAEPKMMNRKRIGFLSVSMLGLLAFLLYLTNRKIWAPIKRKDA